VVFGAVLEGLSVVTAIEEGPTLPGDKPTEEVVIVKSGELEMAEDEAEESKDEL